MTSAGPTPSSPSEGSSVWRRPMSWPVNSLGGKTIDRRAGCGRSARTVRREGSSTPMGLPYPCGCGARSGPDRCHRGRRPPRSSRLIRPKRRRSPLRWWARGWIPHRSSSLRCGRRSPRGYAARSLRVSSRWPHNRGGRGYRPTSSAHHVRKGPHTLSRFVLQLGLSPDARPCLRVDVVAEMSGDRHGPRLDGMLQLAVVTPRADNDLTVSVESFENGSNIHARISAPGGAERKAWALPSTSSTRGPTTKRSGRVAVVERSDTTGRARRRRHASWGIVPQPPVRNTPVNAEMTDVPFPLTNSSSVQTTPVRTRRHLQVFQKLNSFPFIIESQHDLAATTLRILELKAYRRASPHQAKMKGAQLGPIQGPKLPVHRPYASFILQTYSHKSLRSIQ